MLRLECKIIVSDAQTGSTKTVLNYANNIEINKGFDGLTDTCKIIFPRKNGLEDRQIINGAKPIFKRGDKIEVWLGYFPTIKQIFSGYISQVNAKIPIEIEAEDGMFLLKQMACRPFAGTGVTLKQLLTGILPVGYSFTALDITVGDWRVSSGSNVSNVLKQLKSQGLFARMENGGLYVGEPYIVANQKTQVFKFEQNIINDSNLKYQIQEDLKIRVKVNYFYSDNRKTEPYYFGDIDGDLRTINLYNVPFEDVQKAAKRELDRVKYTGYIGTFVTFGEPHVDSGDVASLVSIVMPERNGLYLIKSVNYTWGVNGYRQEIELETKL
jgi:hypothetical protein